MKKPRNARGFTLIELMIVVAIIGILAAVAIPKFAEMLRKSKEASTKGSLTNLRSSLNIYISENEGYAPMIHALVADYVQAVLQNTLTPKYVEAFPTAKLGTYHPDSGDVKMAPHNDRNSPDGTDDANGWCYTSSSGADWWVNCTHTDAKSVTITTW